MRPMFPAFGGLGLLAAVAVGWWAGRSAGLTPASLGVLAAGSFASFGASVLGQAAVRGRVNLIALRDVGLVVAAVVPCCLLARVSLPTGLDVVAMAGAAALTFGRIGCLSAACCYGRPAPWGIRYTSVHAELGFPWHLVGVRLVPVQLFEASVLVLLVPLGSVFEHTQPTGTAFGVLAAVYATLRATLDPFRGDPRPRHGGLSAVQWSAAAVGTMVTIAATFGLVRLWLLPLGASTLIVVAATRFRASALLIPEHVNELAGARDRPMITTCQGICISHGHTGSVEHYSLSRTPPLDAAEIFTLARLLRHLFHPDQTIEVVFGRADVAHFFVKGEVYTTCQTKVDVD